MTFLTILALLSGAGMLVWGLRQEPQSSTRAQYRRASRALSRVQSRVAAAKERDREPR